MQSLKIYYKQIVGIISKLFLLLCVFAEYDVWSNVQNESYILDLRSHRIGTIEF